MKKIISALLCSAMVLGSDVSAFCAETADDSQVGISFSDATNEYKIVGESTIPNGYARFYKEGINLDPTAGLELTDNATGANVTKCFNFNGYSSDLHLPGSEGYEYAHLLNSSSSSGLFVLNFNKTGGTYQKIRVNLSRYSDYFNSDGTHTSTLGGSAHRYTFTKESDGAHTSSLIIVSGGAVSSVAPDHYGMAEFYVSTNIGDTTFFATDFRIDSELKKSSGGGVSGQRFKGLTMGDVDKDGFVAINDATYLQMYLAKTTELGTMAQRNGDVNHSGDCDITDVTVIQNYLAGLK